MGQYFGGSILEPFLESGLTFTILQLPGNELSLIERLQSWDIARAKILAPFFRNLPDKLPMPTALSGFKLFQIFNIFSGHASENSKFKSLSFILS